MLEAGVGPATVASRRSIGPHASTRRVAPDILGWGVLIALLVVPLTYGNAIGNVAILFGLACLITADRAGYREVFRMPHVWLLVASFVLLATSAVVFGGATRESLVAFDFVPLLLAIPVSTNFLRIRIPEVERQLSWLALVGTAVACAVAVFQYVALHNIRPGGWQLSPIHFADIAVTLGFMSAAGLLNKGRREWPLFAAGPLMGIAAGVLSGTRSSLFVAAALLVLWLAFFLRRQTWRLALIPLVAAVAIGVAIAVIVPRDAVRVFDTGTLLGDLGSAQPVNGPEFGFRLDQYQAAIRAFADSPLFGHGWRHEVQSALPYMSTAAQQDYALEHWGYIHNEFLSMSVGMGILGSIAWLLLMAYPPVAVLWMARRGRGISARAAYLVLAPWLGILVGGLTDVLFNTELTKTFYCFIPCAILMLTRQTSAPDAGVTPARAG